MENIETFIKKILMNEKLMKIFRYLVIGVLTTVVSFLVFWLVCYPLGQDPNLANVVSIAIAVLFAYVTNKIIVFKSKTENTSALIKEAFSFVFSRGITILLEIGGVFLMVNILKLEAMLSKILISVLVTILNYIISQFWIFKEKDMSGVES